MALLKHVQDVMLEFKRLYGKRNNVLANEYPLKNSHKCFYVLKLKL